jgi:NTP pyrophosphatase (non-canonical NTP hydrolase)
MSELADLQKSITRTRAERGFVTDPVKIHVLLSEEVGEIASEIKRLWSKNYGDFNRDQLKEEIADVFVLLAALAAQFDIDIEEAVVAKFFQKDSGREWKSARDADSGGTEP